MAKLIGYLIGFGFYLWLAGAFGGKGNNHKNMSNSQIDNEINNYLK